MATVIISQSARSELLDMLIHIAQDNPSRAHSYIDELQEKIVTNLSEHPTLGRPYRGGRYKLVLMGNVILYRYNKKLGRVEILHIYGAGKNWR